MIDRNLFTETMKTLTQEQYAMLLQVLDYIYEHEGQDYDDCLEDGLCNPDNHIYAIATKLGESIK